MQKASCIHYSDQCPGAGACPVQSAHKIDLEGDIWSEIIHTKFHQYASITFGVTIIRNRQAGPYTTHTHTTSWREQRKFFVFTLLNIHV